MNQRLVREVWKRARQRCEYCLIPFPHYRLPFQIDHIIARQHHGATELDNLALACFHCNRHKGPNIAGRDPASGEIVPLFHPRTDVWTDHFGLEEAVQIGLTAIGRATVEVLAINAPDFRQVRETLITEGVFFGGIKHRGWRQVMEACVGLDVDGVGRDFQSPHRAPRGITASSKVYSGVCQLRAEQAGWTPAGQGGLAGSPGSSISTVGRGGIATRFRPYTLRREAFTPNQKGARPIAARLIRRASG